MPPHGCGCALSFPEHTTQRQRTGWTVTCDSSISIFMVVFNVERCCLLDGCKQPRMRCTIVVFNGWGAKDLTVPKIIPIRLKFGLRKPCTARPRKTAALLFQNPPRRCSSPTFLDMPRSPKVTRHPLVAVSLVPLVHSSEVTRTARRPDCQEDFLGPRLTTPPRIIRHLRQQMSKMIMVILSLFHLSQPCRLTRMFPLKNCE